MRNFSPLQFLQVTIATCSLVGFSLTASELSAESQPVSSAPESACAVTVTGDVNLDGTVTSADILYAVGYCFKGGPPPLPCTATGDVNCSGAVTTSDVIDLVSYIFRSGPAPCDVCTLVPDTWTCP